MKDNMKNYIKGNNLNSQMRNLNSQIYKDGLNFLMNTYARLPVIFTRAKMQFLWDADNNKYLDFIAGYGCLNVGHSNPFVIKSLKNQIDKIIQPSNVFFNVPQVKLAQKLCQISEFGSKVFFANSGTEAIEAAIKLARKYSKDKFSPNRYQIISFKKSFHGRTLGALSATAQEEKQNIFQPLLEGFKYAELNNIESVKKQIDQNTCAVLLELIQGEGGINVAEYSFVKELEKICRQNNVLLIFDEVQTGFGRTGKMFAHQNYNVFPDILVVAKSLGGGMPIGAIISTDKVSSVFEPGSHGSTFGGNAASCAAGIAVIDYIIKKNLPLRALKLGKYFFNELEKLKSKYPLIKEVRGMGLMVGVELSKPVAQEIVISALKDKIVINKVSPEILRFLPPLIITKSNINFFIEWFSKKLKQY